MSGALAGSEANGSAGLIDLSGGNVQSAQAVAQWATSRGWATSADGFEVEGTDVITAVTGTCPNVTVTIRGVQVIVNSSTVFKPGTTCANLLAGTRVEVRGILTATATGVQVVATRIGVEDAGGGRQMEGEGRVATVSGTCPSLTITLQGINGTIVTNASTIFSPATACTQIVPGTKIEAKGTLTGTQFLASSITVKDDGAKKKVSGEGVIGAVTGTCPTLTIVIQGARVEVNAATQFVGGSCASLRSGTQVKIDAETQPDGRIIAEKIEIVRTPGRSISGDGTVTSVTGTCPAITMMVRGYPVRTSAATTFSGGTCASITAGTKVDVTGTTDETGVDATSVVIKN